MGGATIAATPDQEMEQQRPPAGPWRIALRRLLRKKIAATALVVIGLFYIVGLFAPVLAPHDYRTANYDRVEEGPSLTYPFGTDRLGRDQLSRIIWSARTTTIVTVATVVAGSLVLAVGLGMLSGYAGGAVDTGIMRTGEVLASLPGLPMLILINATMRDRTDAAVGWLESHASIDALSDGFRAQSGPEFVFLLALGGMALLSLAGLAVWLRGARDPLLIAPFLLTGTLAVLLLLLQGVISTDGAEDYFIIFGALALFSWVGGARVIRSQVLALRETDYVTAARGMGAPTWRVLWSHLLPNVSPIIIVSVSAGLGAIAGSEIALTFLGVGVQEPTPSFGALIWGAPSQRALANHPHLLIFPAIIVGMLIFAFNLLGDALNDVLTPRAR